MGAKEQLQEVGPTISYGHFFIHSADLILRKIQLRYYIKS